MAEQATWTPYNNRWYGLRLLHPPGWTAWPVRGGSLISSDPTGLICAIVQLFGGGQGWSPRQVAEQVVARRRQTAPGLQAWVEPTDTGVSVHTRVVLDSTPVIGSMLIEPHGSTALVTGIQAPDEQLTALTPVLAAILRSLRFEEPVALRRFEDSAEHAFSGYAPNDWAVRAVLHRTPTREQFPLLELTAADPTGQSVLTIPPAYDQYSERPLPFGGGQWAPFPGVAEYLRVAIGPMLQRERPGVRLEGIRAEPEVAEAERRQSGLGPPAQVESASVTTSYPDGGLVMRENVAVTLVRLVTPPIWTARIAFRRRSPADRFSEESVVFRGILESLVADPRWKQQEQARADALLGQARQRVARADQVYAAAVENLGRSGREAAAVIADGVRGRIEAFDRLQQDHVMPTLRGHQIVEDRRDGTRFEVPLDYDAYWADSAHRVWRTGVGEGPPVGSAERLESI